MEVSLHLPWRLSVRWLIPLLRSSLVMKQETKPKENVSPFADFLASQSTNQAVSCICYVLMLCPVGTYYTICHGTSRSSSPGYSSHAIHFCILTSYNGYSSMPRNYIASACTAHLGVVSFEHLAQILLPRQFFGMVTAGYWYRYVPR